MKTNKDFCFLPIWSNQEQSHCSTGGGGRGGRKREKHWFSLKQQRTVNSQETEQMRWALLLPQTYFLDSFQDTAEKGEGNRWHPGRTKQLGSAGPRTMKEKAISRGTPEICRGPLSSIQQSTNPCMRVNNYPGLGQKNPSEMLKETMSTTYKSRNSVYSHQTERKPHHFHTSDYWKRYCLSNGNN